ncbi:unnamed protein product [Phytophthora lilii]|uniref:Unnamed protein product n=1 Tax=Phytophthora lilii TaxID=2077276 RepID=A0A9W6TDG4_9STRA|nr:unnamed protein product [Phytophthora lilii]
MQNLAVDLHSLLHVGQFLVLGWDEGADHDPDVGIGAGRGTEVYDDDDTEEYDDDRLGVDVAGAAAAATLVPQCKQNFCVGFRGWLHLVQALGAAGTGSGAENEDAELTDDTGDGAATGAGGGAAAATFVPHFGQNFCVALSVNWHDAHLCSPLTSDDDDDEFDADEFDRCSGAVDEKLLLALNGAGDEKLLLGVNGAGVGAAATTLVPHCRQNFCAGFSAAWQLTHALDAADAAAGAAAGALDPAEDTDSVESRIAS